MAVTLKNDSIEAMANLPIQHDAVEEREKRLCTGKLKMFELENYSIDESRINCFVKYSKMPDVKPQIRKNESLYIGTTKAMVWLEEKEQSKLLEEFKQKNINISLSEGNRIYRIKNDEKMEKINDAINESMLDHFTLRNMRNTQFRSPSISGRVNGNSNDFIFIEIFEESLKLVETDDEYEIEFHVNRLPFQVQHLALYYVENHKLVDKLINNSRYDYFIPKPSQNPDVSSNHSDDDSSDLYSQLNDEQKRAVESIVSAKNQPLPYILYGPPGTGKTQTLIAAIERIVRSTEKNILICTNSNAACDEITERLVNVLTADEMLRLYARGYDKRKLSDRIKPFSNLRGNEFRFPSLDVLFQFRVIISTLCTVSSLTRGGIGQRPKHFSYVIIEECASTHESMALVAIAGLCTDRNGVYSSIILAGDPKQLDAVTKSDEAIEMGYKTSFMEHLFNRRLYQRDSITGAFNATYITQLVDNYRSHPAILQMPSELFYENSLKAKASQDVTDLFIDSSILPSKKFPIIFRAVEDICKNSEKSFSLSNSKECTIVIDYIKKLLSGNRKNRRIITPSDIGVVTPYKLQSKHISRAIKRENLGNITVGTAEVFQGQERPVMIVSTVRSGGTNIGFVAEPRRMNVIITRAKCLLVIVGNPLTLASNSNWEKLIKYCDDNNALIDKEPENEQIY